MKTTKNTILITGGSAGIGLALAKKFNELGNKVIIVGRDAKKLKEVSLDNAEIDFIQCDITNNGDIENMVLKLEKEYPDLNILINNAGVQYNYYFTEETNPSTKIDTEILTNFTAPVKLTSLLIPLLSTKKEAAIVNLTSGLAYVPKENAPVYCAAKAALQSFTSSIRYQLEETNIKVFELIPPLVETEMTKGRGRDKITPGELAEDFIPSFSKDIYQIRIGKIKLLMFMLRLFPKIIFNKMRNSQ